MQSPQLLVVCVVAVLVLQVILLAIIVMRTRRHPDLMDDLSGVPAHERRAHQVAQCEHFRKMQMHWIDESNNAAAIGDEPRKIRADELSCLWGQVYIMSAAYHRRWETMR